MKYLKNKTPNLPAGRQGSKDTTPNGWPPVKVEKQHKLTLLFHPLGLWFWNLGLGTCFLLGLGIWGLGLGISFAQPYQLNEWDSTTLEKANTAKDIDYLSEEEKNVIFYMNLARMNGPLFAKTLLQAYVDSIEMESDNYVASLIKDLNKSKSKAPLTSRKDLYEVAKTHAKTMGKSGRTGHYDFEKRTREIAGRYDGITENCDYGPDDGFSIVMDLLIDEGIPDVGHRETILDPDVRYVGTSIKKHKKYRYNCVMEFGGGFLK